MNKRTDGRTHLNLRDRGRGRLLQHLPQLGAPLEDGSAAGIVGFSELGHDPVLGPQGFHRGSDEFLDARRLPDPGASVEHPSAPLRLFDFRFVGRRLEWTEKVGMNSKIDYVNEPNKLTFSLASAARCFMRATTPSFLGATTGTPSPSGSGATLLTAGCRCIRLKFERHRGYDGGKQK